MYTNKMCIHQIFLFEQYVTAILMKMVVYWKHTTTTQAEKVLFSYSSVRYNIDMAM